jgi:hypothetical protein
LADDGHVVVDHFGEHFDFRLLRFDQLSGVQFPLFSGDRRQIARVAFPLLAFPTQFVKGLVDVNEMTSQVRHLVGQVR